MDANQPTLGQLLQNMRDAFAAQNISNATFEAKVLLSGLLDLSSLDLINKRDMQLSNAHVLKIESAMEKRCNGMPVYRILGWREFYGLRFALSDGTLEPRPDTEILVEHVIAHVKSFMARQGSCHILDMGTGTGAIALSILNACEGATAVGVDCSKDALATAHENAKNLGLDNRFEALKSDWFSQVSGEVDIIVSNPPYICTDVIDRLDREVREHDPVRALDGGIDGLDAYRTIFAGAAQHMHSQSILAFEIGYDQLSQVRVLGESYGFVMAAAYRDLGGQDRVVIFKP